MSEGSIPRSGLDPSDVFIADTGKEVFVWIGGGASPDEKKNAMTYAHVSYHYKPHQISALMISLSKHRTT